MPPATAEHVARPPFGDPHVVNDMFDRQALRLRAQKFGLAFTLHLPSRSARKRVLSSSASASSRFNRAFSRSSSRRRCTCREADQSPTRETLRIQHLSAASEGGRQSRTPPARPWTTNCTGDREFAPNLPDILFATCFPPSTSTAQQFQVRNRNQLSNDESTLLVVLFR